MKLREHNKKQTMNAPPLITQIEMARQYCERQDQTPMRLLHTLQDLEERFHPIGFAMLECQALDSREYGMLWILPYGPFNTFPTLEALTEHPVSRNGMASNMSTVKAYALARTNSITENETPSIQQEHQQGTGTPTIPQNPTHY